MMKFNFDSMNVLIGHIILFIVFLASLPPENTHGLERIVVTYITILLLLSAITRSWKNSFIAALAITLFIGLLDSRGPFDDYRYAYNKYMKSPSLKAYMTDINHRIEVQGSPSYVEPFDIKPAGEGEEKNTNAYSSAKTTDSDNTNITADDLDKMLEEDEKKSVEENEHLKKAGGGLDQLKDLLDMAKKESPYTKDDKSTNDYTPAQAQRATYHLIDTVKQLKETMAEMMPLMQTGKNLMNLQKQMEGVRLDDKDKK